MSKFAHSVEWAVLLNGNGYYPCIQSMVRVGMGRLIEHGLMYPEAHRRADDLNRGAKILAPTYEPEEGP